MKLKFIILALLSSICLGSFTETQAADVRNPLTADEQARFDYYFFEANRLRDIGEFDVQLEALRMCLEIDSTNGSAQAEIDAVRPDE